MLISQSFCPFLVVQSLARVGQWRDSSVAESWFASDKTELICTDVWSTISGLRSATFDYQIVMSPRRGRLRRSRLVRCARRQSSGRALCQQIDRSRARMTKINLTGPGLS